MRGPVTKLIDFLHRQQDSPDLLDAGSKQRIEQSTINAAENLRGSKHHFSGFENVDLHFEDLQNIALNTDENYLKTILRNLTGNAIKRWPKPKIRR